MLYTVTHHERIKGLRVIYIKQVDLMVGRIEVEWCANCVGLFPGLGSKYTLL